MVQENERVRAQIPELFATLMEPHLERTDEALSPGLTVLRWTSLSLDTYVQSVQVTLQQLELLVKRVSDTLQFRVEGVLQEIQDTVLCEMPDNEPWTVTEFVSRTEV